MHYNRAAQTNESYELCEKPDQNSFYCERESGSESNRIFIQRNDPALVDDSCWVIGWRLI